MGYDSLHGHWDSTKLEELEIVHPGPNTVLLLAIVGRSHFQEQGSTLVLCVHVCRRAEGWGSPPTFVLEFPEIAATGASASREGSPLSG